MYRARYDYDSREPKKSKTPPSLQTHVHEFVGSTKLAGDDDEKHNHRFAGVTSEMIPIDNDDHVHAISVSTDFFDHRHEITVMTGPAINVGNGKHIHFVAAGTGTTTLNDGHCHELEFTTLINQPLL